MCDYSLMQVKSRAAAVGDKLITTSFLNTPSRGFASVDDLETAVCVLPGTELAFDTPITARKDFYLGMTTFEHKVAIFRQLFTDQVYHHHDALEMPDGQTAMLTDMPEGQTATVLQMPAKPKTAEEAKAQQRLEIVG